MGTGCLAVERNGIKIHFLPVVAVRSERPLVGGPGRKRTSGEFPHGDCGGGELDGKVSCLKLFQVDHGGGVDDPPLRELGIRLGVPRPGMQPCSGRREAGAVGGRSPTQPGHAGIGAHQPVPPKRGQFTDGHAVSSDEVAPAPGQSPHDLAGVVPKLK